MTFDISKERKRTFYEIKNMLVESNHRKILGYLLVQRVILFLAVYEYLDRLLQDAVTQTGSNTYEYDANGNMQTRNGITITYDYDNRPVGIGSTVFVYDYSGKRVKKNGTVYIGKLYECLGTSCTKYIFAGGTRIASKSSSATYYYHTDHLGSSNVVTDIAGNKVQETYYYPFGETRYNNGNATHYKFTGQEEDAETGLYYYGARYYDPVIGRFISADSIVQDPFDPQSLNRYSYCINNPLKYVDPDGHFFLELLIASMVIGAVTSGIQSHWNIGEMARELSWQVQRRG